MERIQSISDIAKETLTFLAFFDQEMIKKIPEYVIANLCAEAADSNLDFYINKNKNFQEQEISEKSKDLLALIYYEYIAQGYEKKEILNQWNLNEQNYQNMQNEKYSYDKIFKNKEKTTCTELIKVETKKETLFQKIKELIKRIVK